MPVDREGTSVIQEALRPSSSNDSSAADSTLQRLSLSEQALALINQAMVAGEMQPGEIYSAAALASRLRVSNSPVREAMLTLVNQGLMEPVRNRGYRVVPITRSDVRDIYRIRVMLEVPSMRELAERKPEIDRARFEALAKTIVETAQSKDIARYLLADREFHLGLTAYLGNERLTALVGNLRDQTRLYGLKTLAGTPTLVESALEHQALLDALIAGDADLTEKLMRTHLAHIVHEWSSEPDDGDQAK